MSMSCFPTTLHNQIDVRVPTFPADCATRDDVLPRDLGRTFPRATEMPVMTVVAFLAIFEHRQRHLVRALVANVLVVLHVLRKLPCERAD